MLGGHKGYGLAAIVEILCASLQSGAFLHGLLGLDEKGNKQHFKVGHFFLAMNVENFVDLETYQHTTGELLRELRASRKSPDCSRIYTAGEKEYEMEKVVRERGVAANPNLQKEIKFIQQELGLLEYQFPF
jgi:LDH2 family malate/lactate/ureidoglycolate dehydrogenase